MSYIGVDVARHGSTSAIPRDAARHRRLHQDAGTENLRIDIGDVTCIAQIGAPFSVASTRQRLGRSGRRPGQPAILRQYAIEAR